MAPNWGSSCSSHVDLPQEVGLWGFPVAGNFSECPLQGQHLNMPGRWKENKSGKETNSKKEGGSPEFCGHELGYREGYWLNLGEAIAWRPMFVRLVGRSLACEHLLE